MVIPDWIMELLSSLPRRGLAWVLSAMILLAACGPVTPGPSSPEPEATQGAPQAEGALPDDQARELMDQLASRSRDESQTALDRILSAQDPRFIAVLIELMRAREIGILAFPEYGEIIAGLERLSGQSFGRSWPDWIEWYGGTELEPPPGFTGWKGRLMARIDPEFGGFLYEGAASNIRVEEIVWGGVRVDGIPSLDQPATIDAAEADYLEPGEPVFGVAIEGEARAYPLRILDWHEMANDELAGVPFSLAYCTLCGAGIAYDGRSPDGEMLTFGSSGFLYRSNKLMYDRQTRTLWNQLTGQPVVGELVGSEIQLDLLPVVVSSWQDWQEQHPETDVLSLDTGYQRSYKPGAAYGNYFSSAETMFPVAQRDEALATKERVYALRLDGAPKAYSLEALNAERVVNDQVGSTEVVLVMTRGNLTVEGDSLRSGPVSYSSGGEVRAFRRGQRQFQPGPEPDTIVDEDGTHWQVTEGALVGPDGASLPRIPGHLAYWFGWYAFFPDTEVYSAE